MQTEIEAKFANIDSAQTRQKLEALGARLVHPEVLMRRKNFDFPDKRLEKVGGWVRLRDEGDKVTLAYKQVNERSLHGTKEVSVTVSDFERTAELLACTGLAERCHQESRREKWECRGCDVTLDTWPWIPTFIEIEGPNEGAVRALAADLGFDWGAAMYGSVENFYQALYDVSEQEVITWPVISFSPVPDWLAVKRKK